MLPDLRRLVILGQPWLVKWLPQTNWETGETTVSHKGRRYTLQTYMRGRSQLKKESMNEKEELLSVHAMNRLVKRERPERVFMALVQGKGDEEEGDETGSD